jgi:hypothetical protein
MAAPTITPMRVRQPLVGQGGGDSNASVAAKIVVTGSPGGLFSALLLFVSARLLRRTLREAGRLQRSEADAPQPH